MGKGLKFGWLGWLLLFLVWGDSAGATIVSQEPPTLHFFWAANCPHCGEMKPYLQQLQQRYPRLQVKDYDVWQDRVAFEQMVALGKRSGTTAVSTPTTALGDGVWFGFTPEVAAAVEAELRRCLAEGCADPLAPPTEAEPSPPANPDPAPLQLPVFGQIDPQAISLPLFTLVIALLDSFNPCAFFVLLFLLSLLVHARSRGLMLLVGATFVLCSGLIYFLFMAAWLNLFLLAGSLPLITTAAGLVALLVAAINIKDYFRFHQGVSLSIPEQAKPQLFERMRQLVKGGRTLSVLGGTLVLALLANSYELLCTAGFPMVYTRVLTLRGLSNWEYYGYLALYNSLYILPLLTIVLVFTFTLGSRKLSEQEGRILKLVSGLMMLGLGLVLLLQPALLNNLFAALGLLALSLVLAALIVHFDHRPKRS